MIFLDTNVLSETLKKQPNEAVIAWLTRHDAELALPTVTIAEIAFGIGAAVRQGRTMSAPDGMIAAITRVNGGRLATRNLTDFETTGLDLISPWDF